MMEDMLEGAFCSGLLSLDRMMHPWEKMDLTETTYRYLFPPIKDGKVSLRHGAVIGLPECGKTEMINDIAIHFRDHYGEGRVNIVFCDWLQDALDNMDSKPIQLLIVDDAVKKANSRKSGGNADDTADYFNIRHVFEAKARTRTGAIILIYIAQRFKSLDIVFRNAMYLWFKTSTIDPDDRDIIIKYIGASTYQDLKELSARMYYHHDDSAKDHSIVFLPLEDKTGIFTTTMQPRIITMVGQQEIKTIDEVFSFDRAKFIENMMKEERWKRPARCYQLKDNGLTYDQIALDPIVMDGKDSISKTRIAQLIAQVRGELALRSGTAYEAWKAQQLTKAGLDVRHDGKRGQPDISTIDPSNGNKRYYSCKCFEFDRELRIARKELEPEILAAIRGKGQVVLSVWNLWDMREQEVTYEPARVPETIVMRPLTN